MRLGRRPPFLKRYGLRQVGHVIAWHDVRDVDRHERLGVLPADGLQVVCWGIVDGTIGAWCHGLGARVVGGRYGVGDRVVRRRDVLGSWVVGWRRGTGERCDGLGERVDGLPDGTGGRRDDLGGRRDGLGDWGVRRRHGTGGRRNRLGDWVVARRGGISAQASRDTVVAHHVVFTALTLVCAYEPHAVLLSGASLDFVQLLLTEEERHEVAGVGPRLAPAPQRAQSAQRERTHDILGALVGPGHGAERSGDVGIGRGRGEQWERRGEQDVPKELGEFGVAVWRGHDVSLG